LVPLKVKPGWFNGGESMAGKSRELPSAAREVSQNYPAIWKSYTDLGAACSQAGPLTGRTLRLVKLALAIGVGSEGAVHSHARRALEEGITIEELRHAALLAAPTMGFPQAVKALRWIEDVFAADQVSK
jgi:alkylhydroperoxidase/carboxymuconolactone decarboxylase family protein YurZ